MPLSGCTAGLLLGLDFGLPVTSLKYYKHFFMSWDVSSGFTKLLKFKLRLTVLKHSFYHSWRKNIIMILNFCKHSSSLFSRKDFNILKNLGKQNQLYISKPDKGNWVVIMKKTDYTTEVNNILNDNTKFICTQADEKKLILKLKDKVNNFLRQFRNSEA